VATDGGYRIDQTGFSGTIDSCTQSDIKINGILHIRPTMEVMTGLDGATAGGQTNWTSYKLQ
jgi:hypothetical protein